MGAHPRLWEQQVLSGPCAVCSCALCAQNVHEGLEPPHRTAALAGKPALTCEYAVERMGLEPTTPCLQSRCSSQLSYVPRRERQDTRRAGECPKR